MKKITLLSAVCLLLISACKKDNTSPNVKSDQKLILGSWYYSENDVKYFDAKVEQMYDDFATDAQLKTFPNYNFYNDFSGAYGSANFSYSIKSANNVDSLIFTGNINLRFKIVSISSDLLVLERTYPDAQAFYDHNNNIVYSSYAQSHGTFVRNQR